MSESFVISQGKYIQVFAVLATGRYMTCQTKENQIQPPESEGSKHIISKRLYVDFAVPQPPMDRYCLMAEELWLCGYEATCDWSKVDEEEKSAGIIFK